MPTGYCDREKALLPPPPPQHYYYPKQRFSIEKTYLVVKRQFRYSLRWYYYCDVDCSSVCGRAGRASPTNPPRVQRDHWTIHLMSFSSCVGLGCLADMGSWLHDWSFAIASPPDRFHDDRNNWNSIRWRALVMQWSAHQQLHIGSRRSCPRHRLACEQVQRKSCDF